MAYLLDPDVIQTASIEEIQAAKEKSHLCIVDFSELQANSGLLGISLITAAATLAFFKKKKWF